MVAAFEAAYRQRFSFLMPDKPVVVEAVSVEADGASEPAAERPAGAAGAGPPAAAAAGAGADVRRRRAGPRWPLVPPAAGLRPGDGVPGPALIVEDFATTVVEPGWQAERHRAGLTCCSPGSAAPAGRARGTEVDPVLLEIFNNLFMSVAEQMGVRLRSTAHSVNIKERLDFSCAIFDARGGLIANAPHMPVHLGSMGESIKIVIAPQCRHDAARRRVRAQRPLPRRHPPARHHRGHAGVRRGRRRPILFFVASRGHHAEIGGITPGSMPAFSPRVEEEGVLIDNWLLVRDGVLREAETLRPAGRRARTRPATRQVNLADLRAQIAANEQGRAGAAPDGASTSAWTWCAPTWATCRTTPRRRCAGSSRGCATARSATSWTTAP